jgi:hypothetical protein
MIPERVRAAVEESIPTLESVARVIAPLTVLVPLMFLSEPALLTPAPFNVIGSAVVIPPGRLSVAPLLTVVDPDVAPKAVLFAAISVPALIDVVPV